MRNLTYFSLFLVLFTQGCASQQLRPDAAQARTVASDLGYPDAVRSHDYPKIFEYARKLLTRKEIKQFLKETFADELKIPAYLRQQYGFPEKIKEMSESQFVLLLSMNPQAWPVIDQYLAAVPQIVESDAAQKKIRKEYKKKFKSLLSDRVLRAEFKKYNNPTNALVLLHPNEPGYSNVKFHVNHQKKVGDKIIAADNLKQVWIDFISAAKTELVLNVFDFDLGEVAAALIERAKAGVKIRLGIDAGVISARPEVKQVYDELAATPGIFVHAVQSVGLNHQKISARDWQDKSTAAVLFSSGNLTQSCSGPEGDLKDVTPRPQFSVPNANHVITMDSYLLANVVNHELSKTLDPGLQLRGSNYPLGGGWKVFQGDSNDTLKDPFIIIVFSPNGAIGDINRDVISQMIYASAGNEIKMLQFAFSSKVIGNALKKRARQDTKKHGQFRFRSVGDTSFAARDWSVFLDMSCYGKDNEAKHYFELKDCDWKKIMSAENFAAVKNQIRAAPDHYGNHQYKMSDGTSRDVTSKIHHKSLISGDYAIVGTSYNFSEGALSNNEQLLVFHDPAVVEQANAMFEGMYELTTKSLEEVVQKRNLYNK